MLTTKKIKWKTALYACVLKVRKRLWSTSIVKMRCWEMCSKKVIEIYEKFVRLRRLRPMVGYLSCQLMCAVSFTCRNDC